MADQLPSPGANPPAGRFVGLVFMAIGVLWLTLTGLCTAFSFFAMLSTGQSADLNLSDIMIILTVAVPSALIGGGVYFVGRLLRPRQ
jgi:hypothetical protein